MWSEEQQVAAMRLRGGAPCRLVRPRVPPCNQSEATGLSRAWPGTEATGIAASIPHILSVTHCRSGNSGNDRFLARRERASRGILWRNAGLWIIEGCAERGCCVRARLAIASNSRLSLFGDRRSECGRPRRSPEASPHRNGPFPPELLSRVVFWGLNQAAFCRTPSVKILPSRTRAIW